MSTEYVSGQLTKVYKCRKAIKLKFHDKMIDLADDEKKKIQVYWEQARTKNNTLFNGDVLTINKIENRKEDICIHLYKTDYAHLTYVMNLEKEEITGCKSIAAGGLFVTKDGYILLGQMGNKTSFPGIIQCIGGGVSQEDTVGPEAPLNTVIRECYEETGIQPEENSIIEAEKYIYIRNKMTTLGFCYVVHLDLCKDTINDIFTNFRKKDNEISKLVFLKEDNNEIKKFCEKNILVDYLKPVLFDYANLDKVIKIEALHF